VCYDRRTKNFMLIFRLRKHNSFLSLQDLMTGPLFFKRTVPLIWKICVSNCPIGSFFSNLYTCLSLYPPFSVEYLISFPNIHSAVHTYLNYPTLHISRYPRGNLALLLVGGEPFFIQWESSFTGPSNWQSTIFKERFFDSFSTIFLVWS
jgi:hypothetical protein